MLVARVVQQSCAAVVILAMGLMLACSATNARAQEPELEPSLAAALVQVSKVAGVEPTELAFMPAGELPNLFAVWFVPTPDGNDRGLVHRGIEIRLFISQPAPEVQVAAEIEQLNQAWLRGRNAEANRRSWVLYLLRQSSRMNQLPLGSLPEPLRAEALAAMPLAQELRRGDERARAAGTKSPLEDFLGPEAWSALGPMEIRSF